LDELEIFEELVRLKRAGRSGVLATVVESSGSSPRKAGAKLLMRDDSSLLGSVGGGRLEEETLRVGRQALAEGRPRTLSFSLDQDNDMVCGGKVLVYLEPLMVAARLLILGSGHVGQALLRFARSAGFAVTLVDPTGGSGSARVDGFAPADLSCSPQEAFSRSAIDGHTYVVIASPSHHLDFQSVQAALKTPAAYIGMLGSRRKREALFSFLQDSGCPEAEISRVTTPAGLAIGAQTPEEIAVSILAQLIALRRTHDLRHLGTDPGGGFVQPDGTPQAPAPFQ
jgi:xanthine dehydrogenase accessory factor